jgi:UDP:flavonoid glycosyltransferase YjiC (YdhE family)
MKRFLFVVPPITSHMRPAAAVAQALRERGHEVAWAGPQRFLGPLLGPGAIIYPTGMRMYRDLRACETDAAQAFLAGYVAPLTRFVERAVDEAVEQFGPDAVVADQHAIAGALAAYRRNLLWASLLPGSRGLVDLYRGSTIVHAWINGTLAGLAPDVPKEHLIQLLYSPHLRIAFTTTALTGALGRDDATILVGPALGDRPDDPSFPWVPDPARSLVLVTVGTLNIEISADFYQRACRALEPLGDRVQAIVVAPPEVLPDPPEHVLVVPRVPMLALLPHVHAVVTHAGMNTVAEALWHGIPLVAAPITLDQPTTADQVVACGAGLRVDFDHAGPEELRKAILTVLDETSYRNAARRVGESFRAAGGAAAAADHLLKLAFRGPQ